MQCSDTEIGPIVRLLLNQKEQPTVQELAAESECTKFYAAIWFAWRIVDGVVYRNKSPGGSDESDLQLLTPVCLRQEMLRYAHTGLTDGHLGRRKTICQLRRRCYWKSFRKDVERYCRQCDQCVQYWRGKLPKTGLLQPTVVGAPHERWSIDLTGPHPRSRRNNVFIFTCLDVFTKWAEAYPIPNKEAATVAKVFMENIVCKFGTPLSILSDQGREVDGLIMNELCRLLDVEKLHTTAYKASTNAQVEKFHRTLNSMIGRVISDKQTEWDDLLPYVMAAYRSSVHDSTGYSPNMLVFGRENRAPLDIVLGIPEPESSARTYDGFVEDVQTKLKAAYDIARAELQQAANRNKRYYDMSVRPAKFAPGDWVFYYNPRRYTGKSEKWSRKYIGPMLVLKQLGPVNYLLQKSKKALPFVSHVDKLKRCYSRPPVPSLEEGNIQQSVAEAGLLENCQHSPDGRKTLQEASDQNTALKMKEPRRTEPVPTVQEEQEVPGTRQEGRPRRAIRLPARFRCE